jgi:hypothetical protein
MLVGAALDSVEFFALDVAAGKGDDRRALVFVEGLRDHQVALPMPDPPVLLRAARQGTSGVFALVLMPAADDASTPIERCMDRAAPGQSVP